MSVDWLTVEIHWYVPILFVVAYDFMSFLHI